MALETRDRYDVLEHIGCSVWGLRYSPKNLFAMLTCYFDEAGGDDCKFIVVAGFVASIQQWQNFEYDWRILLSKYDVPYLHMRELAHFKGPFRKWKRQPGTRAKFLAMAADIINCAARFGVSVYIHHKDFEYANREYELSELFSSPYALAGRLCVAEANRERRQTTSGPLDMEYVFEEGGPDKGGLLRAMSIAPMLSSPIFKPSRDIKDRKVGLRRGVVQLQAADYLAYEIIKFARDHPRYKRGERFPRASLGALTQTHVFRRFISLERLRAFCRALHIKKRGRG